MGYKVLSVYVVLALAAGCQETVSPATAAPDAAVDVVLEVTTDAAPDVLVVDTSVADTATVDVTPELPPADVDTPNSWPPMVVGTWNLKNFSIYGATEFRIDDIAAKINELAPDVMGIQELKVKEGTDGSPPQAWDVLLEQIPEYAGLHAPWDTGNDTTVGLIYKKDTVEVLTSKTLFEGDWYAFPRPPLQVTLRVEKGTDGGQWAQFTVIVLHLKAFGADWERRRDACDKLHNYLDSGGVASGKTIVLGDLNDDPYDSAADNNVFDGNFLNNIPNYYFVTYALPPESVTSTGYHHYVGDTYIEGEFLDHIIVTGELYDPFSSITPTIHGVPPAQYDNWAYEVTDHFPVTATFTP